MKCPQRRMMRRGRGSWQERKAGANPNCRDGHVSGGNPGPALRAVQHSTDFHCWCLYPVHHDERKGGQDKLAGAVHPDWTAFPGESFGRCDAVVEGMCDAFSCGRILLANLFDTVRKVSGGFGRPANVHQEPRVRSIWRRTSSCETDLPWFSEARPFWTSCLNHGSWSK
jgi:hypothetical protein